MLLSPKDQLPVLAAGSAAAFELSFVVVCDAHTGELAEALQGYSEVIETLPQSCELILVNCGVPPHDWHAAKNVMHTAGMPITVVTVNRAISRSAALSVAVQHSGGEVIVALPSYLQCQPESIRSVVAMIDEGYDYVASKRVNRVDEKREQTRSNFFNRAVRAISGLHLSDINSGLKAFRREVVDTIPVYGDQHLYLPVLAAKQGFQVTEVPVAHRDERKNPNDSGLSIYLRRGLDLLTLFFLLRFTQKPFRFFGGIGSGLLGAGILVNAVLAFQKLAFAQSLADRPMLVLGTLLMVLGINLFSLGLLGELIIFANAGGIKEFQILDVYQKNDCTAPAHNHETVASRRA